MNGDGPATTPARAAVDRRGVSAVVGLVLLFGIVLVGSVAILLLGGSVVQDAQDSAELTTAEDRLQSFRASLRTLSESESEQPNSLVLQSPKPGESFRLEMGGRISFTLNGNANCTASRELGTVTYTQDGRRVAYQASGVWRLDDDDGRATMVSAPNLDYRIGGDEMAQVRVLTFPFTNVNATASSVTSGNELVAEQNGVTSRRSLRRDLCLAGPSTDEIRWVDNVTVRIENNRFHRAWAEYLRQELTVDGSAVATVDVDNSTRSVVARDIPLGIVNDDDNDGFVDPPVNLTATNPPPGVYNASTYPASDPDVDNCPPEKEPRQGSTNRNQNNSDGDKWGDVCDNAPFDGNRSGLGTTTYGTGSPTVDGTDFDTTVTSSTVTVDYEVDASQTNGTVDTVGVALVDADNGTIVDIENVPVDAGSVTATGTLSAANDGGSYAVVSAARALNGNTSAMTQEVVVTDSSSSSSSVSVPNDDYVEVTASQANVTLLGTEIAELRNVESAERPPLDVMFVLDDSGSNEDHEHALRTPGSTGGTYEVPENHTYIVREDAARTQTYGAGSYTVPEGQRWLADTGGVRWNEAFESRSDGTVKDTGATAWSTDSKGTSPTRFELNQDEFQISNTDGKMLVWRSEEINISSMNESAVTAQIRGFAFNDRLDEGGPYEDTLQVQYVVDGTTETITTRHDDISSGYETVSESGITGNTLRVVIKAETTSAGEVYAFDDVRVSNRTVYTDGDTASFSSPTQVRIDWRSNDGDSSFQPGERLNVYDDMTCALYTQCLGSGPRDELIVKDSGNDPNEERVDASKTFIDELNTSEGDRAGAIEFTSSGSEIRQLGQAFGALKDDIENDIDAGGGTRIDRGLDAAIDEVEQNGKSGNEKVIVLLSDGVNNQVWQDDDTIDAANRAARQNITIYTVGLGSGADRPLLENVASKTGGEFYEVSNASGLEQRFAKIAGDVTEREPVQRIELKQTGGAVEISDASTPVQLEGGDLSTPSTPYPTTPLSLGNGTSRVSLSIQAEQCANPTTVGTDSNPNTGEQYNVTSCDGAGRLVTVDNGTDGHEIYTDGESVPDYGDVWYRQAFEKMLEQYETATGEDVVQGDQFDLDGSQAVFALRDGTGNYSALLFDADESSSSSSPTLPSISPPDSPIGGRGPPVDVEPGNGFVIDVDVGEVILDDDG
jgi:Mg-chelatase subunit ChlD